MNQSQYNQLFSFIWNIATDVLVYAFEKGEYKNIIIYKPKELRSLDEISNDIRAIEKRTDGLLNEILN